MRDGVMSAIPTLNTSRLLDPRLKAGAIEINEALRADTLRYFLRLVSIGSLAAYIPWIALILLDAPILQPGGALAPMLRFQPYNADYEGMLVAINVVWAIMLWRASNDP